jgi:anti-anti-sigma factor
MTAHDAREPRLERVDVDDGVIVLELAGELDLASGPRFRELVDDAAGAAPRLVVVDIEEVGFMDSTMLRELLRAQRDVDQAGGELVVAGAQPTVQRLLQLTGTDDVFAVAASRDEALASHGRPT